MLAASHENTADARLHGVVPQVGDDGQADQAAACHHSQQVLGALPSEARSLDGHGQASDGHLQFRHPHFGQDEYWQEGQQGREQGLGEQQPEQAGLASAENPPQAVLAVAPQEKPGLEIEEVEQSHDEH